MSEEEAKEWVKNKANQQKVVDRFFEDYKPSKIKSAVFMAGIPGAGKTEFVANMDEEVKKLRVPIEHDRLVEYIDGYKPEEYYSYRKAGSVLVTRVLKECLNNGYGFVFDGTLSHENGIRDIKKAIKNDYSVMIIYVVQSAKVAWQLTQDRELVKKRAIQKEGFINTCNRINHNLLRIFRAFKDDGKFAFWILDKTYSSDLNTAVPIFYALNAEGDFLADASEIEDFLSQEYNVKELD